MHREIERTLLAASLILAAATTPAAAGRSGPTGAAGRTEEPDEPVLRAVAAYSFWSSLGLEHFRESCLRLGAGEPITPGEVLAARELEALLAGDSRVVLFFGRRRVESGREGFVKALRRARFQHRAREGFLEGPQIERGEEGVLVKLVKYVRPEDPGEPPQVIEERLVLERRRGRWVVSALERRYRSPGPAEAGRIPAFRLPPPRPPEANERLGAWKRELERLPPRAAGPGEVRYHAAVLRDPENPIALRALAAWELGSIGPGAGAAVPELAAAVRASPALVRTLGAVALGRLGTEAREAVPPLREALRSGGGALRFHAAWALERLGYPAAEV